MSRDWFAVQGRLVRSPKFRRLPEQAQLSLLYVWALAGDETPEATWPSEQGLADVLELAGRPRGDVQVLLEAHWLDRDERGRVLVHDWDDHQLAATAAIKRAFEADRLRTWRRKKRGESGPSPAPPSVGENKRPDNGSNANVRVRTQELTCPACGDLLDERDRNLVVVDRHGALAHRSCPGLVPASP